MVAVEGNTLFHILFKRTVFVFQHLFKRVCRFYHNAAEIECFYIGNGVYLFQTVQRQKFIDKLADPCHLRCYIIDPLILSVFICQHLRIRRDNGDRRFQFMTCIRYKLFLQFCIFRKRLDDHL